LESKLLRECSGVIELNMAVEDGTRYNIIFQSLKEIIESEIEEHYVWTLLWEKGVWLGKQP